MLYKINTHLFKVNVVSLQLLLCDHASYLLNETIKDKNKVFLFQSVSAAVTRFEKCVHFLRLRNIRLK